MGIYYDSWLVHGLYVPSERTDLDDPYQWMHQNTPPGFTYLSDGHYDEEDERGFVLTKPYACVQTMDSSCYGFTSFEVDLPLALALHDQRALMDFAGEHGIEPKIGWWAVSSCG